MPRLRWAGQLAYNIYDKLTTKNDSERRQPVRIYIHKEIKDILLPRYVINYSIVINIIMNSFLYTKYYNAI